MLAPRTVEAGREIRSIFISDLHLGSRFARVESLLAFLERQSPDYLYLVGDIVDGWCLKRKWYWPDTYSRLLDRLVEMAASGTAIRFTPGNHDEFLRRFLMNNELVCIDNEFIHRGADDRQFVILHGDLFDDVEEYAKWLSVTGSFGYEVILRLDHWINRMLTFAGCRRRRISQTIKERVKRVVQFVSGFESRVVEYARQKDCDAVICGHIHYPYLRREGDVLYINLGDWVENNTALIEYDDGHLELVDMDRRRSIGESRPQKMVDRAAHRRSPLRSPERPLAACTPHEDMSAPDSRLLKADAIEDISVHDLPDEGFRRQVASASEHAMQGG